MHSNWKQKVIHNFDTQARHYNQNSHVQKTVAQTLARYLPELNAPRVLEIGCGTGAMTQHLLKQYPNAHFTITDISPKMLAQTQKMFPNIANIEWSVMDGENPPNNQKYDLIISNMVFQWFEDKQQSLTRLKERLTPNGQILFSTPSPNCFKQWRATLERLDLSINTMETFEWPGVFQEEEIEINYGSTLEFLRSLKQTGAHTPDQSYNILDAQDLKKACTENDKQYGGKTTWHIRYGRLSVQE